MKPEEIVPVSSTMPPITPAFIPAPVVSQAPAQENQFNFNLPKQEDGLLNFGQSLKQEVEDK